MEKTDDFMFKKLLWKAERHGLPTNSSFHFSDMDENRKEYLTAYIDKEASGVPVLFFSKPGQQWTLLCTRQVICNNNETIFRLNIKDISSFMPPIILSTIKDRNSIKEFRKAELDQVTVLDKQGNYNVLHADKGADLFALWNILLMAVRMSN